MVGSNYSIHGCSNSKNKIKGLGIFRVPTNNDKYNKKWCDNLVQISTRDKVVDNQLREQIAKRSLYVHELHYREDQIIRPFLVTIDSVSLLFL